MSGSFQRMATVDCSTKRSPDIVGGKRGAPAIHLSNLKCTPLYPVDGELKARLALETPHQLLQTFIEGDNDIVPGDDLVVGSTEYPIKEVEDWPWQSTSYQHLVVEKLRN